MTLLEKRAARRALARIQDTIFLGEEGICLIHSSLKGWYRYVPPPSGGRRLFADWLRQLPPGLRGRRIWVDPALVEEGRIELDLPEDDRAWFASWRDLDGFDLSDLSQAECRRLYHLGQAIPAWLRVRWDPPEGWEHPREMHVCWHPAMAFPALAGLRGFALRQAILYAELALSRPLTWSTGSVASELLLHFVPERLRKLPPLPQEIEHALRLACRDAARDLAFPAAGQPVTLDPEGGIFLSVIDKNSAYLSGASGVSLGGGGLRLMAAGEADFQRELEAALQASWTGFVLVEGATPPEGEILDGRQAPAVIDRPGWYAISLAAFAARRGWQLSCSHMLLYEERRYHLKELSGHLWDAREAARVSHAALFSRTLADEVEAAEAAAEAITKEVALKVMGRLARAGNAVERPDWWAFVVSRAREALLANLVDAFPALLQQCRGRIVGAYTDAVLVQHEETIKPGAIPRAGKLGGYKLSGTWGLSRDLVEEARGKRVGQLLAYLKRNERDRLE